MKPDTEKISSRIPEMSESERERVRENAEIWLASGVEDKMEAATGVLEALTRITSAEYATFYERLSGMAVTERVAEAFKKVPLSETDRKVLQALLDHPGGDSPALSRACGWGGMSWHMHFGKMCARRAAYLWPAPHAEKRGADFYCGILTDWSWDSGMLTYKLKPEVAEAFAAMGIRSKMEEA